MLSYYIELFVLVFVNTFTTPIILIIILVYFHFVFWYWKGRINRSCLLVFTNYSTILMKAWTLLLTFAMMSCITWKHNEKFYFLVPTALGLVFNTSVSDLQLWGGNSLCKLIHHTNDQTTYYPFPTLHYLWRPCPPPLTFDSRSHLAVVCSLDTSTHITRLFISVELRMYLSRTY